MVTTTPKAHATSSIPTNKAVIAPSAANGLKISDLTVDGSSVPKLHGINAFKSTVDLDNVTVKNNTKYGLVVNSSQVTATDITTSNNSWGGIDVDQNDNSSSLPSKLTVKNTSHHSETGADIYVDNTTHKVSVDDVDGQYSHAPSGIPGRDNDQVYKLLPATPTCTTANSGNFEDDTTGSVDGQNGWKSTGSFDQAVVNNHSGYDSFGCKSLRISNATTSGSFADQTFSNAVTPAGETSTSATKDHYEASFDIASTKQTEQSGLSLSVSPDDGTGNRMSYLRFEDQTDGIHVFFDDVTGTDNNSIQFNETEIATLSRDQTHNVKFVIDYKDGASNDVVKVYIDNSFTPAATGKSWENYYRYDTEQAGNHNKVPSTDRLLFRAAGTAAPTTDGYGYLFDNVTVATSKTSTPTSTNGGSGGGNGGNSNGTPAGLGSAGSTQSTTRTSPYLYAFGLGNGSVLGANTTTPANDQDTDGDTLSTSTSDKDKKGDVKAAKDDSSDNGCYEILGICWYWWVAILAALIAIVTYIIARRRRLQA